MPYRTWLITGVSSGFGYELCRQLLEKGDKVIGTGRNKNNVASLIDKYTGTFDCEILDVIDVPAIHKVVDSSFDRLGRTRNLLRSERCSGPRHLRQP